MPDCDSALSLRPYSSVYFIGNSFFKGLLHIIFHKVMENMNKEIINDEEFDLMKKKMDPAGVILGQIFLSDYSGQFSLYYRAKLPGEDFELGLFTLIDELLADDLIRIEPTYSALGTGFEYYSKFDCKYLFNILDGTYKLTADDLMNPTEIRLEMVDNPQFIFTLQKAPVIFPYDN